MAQRIIQICDKCKVELDESKSAYGRAQNYENHHRVIIQVKNSAWSSHETPILICVPVVKNYCLNC